MRLSWFYPLRHRAFDWLDYMTARERAVLVVLGGLLVVSAIWSLFGWMSHHTRVIAQAGGTYREAALGQPHYLNPILASTNDLDSDITRLVYSSLFKLNETMQLQPDLADSHEISSDQREYTVHLKPGIRWHDSQPLTADDVIFTIASIQTPEYASPLANSFQGVEMEKVDDQTVRFKLKQPYALFLYSLTVGIAPRHVWESIPPQNAALAEQMLKPVGTGPFRFGNITTRRRTGTITTLRLVRNPDFYGAAPYLDSIDFTFFSSHEEATQALLAGQVDGVSFLPLNLFDQLASRRQVTIHRLFLPQYFALFFNQNKSDIVADAGVRSALALAIDRGAIIAEALRGQGDPLHLPIPPGVDSYNHELPAPTVDVNTARQNLDDAGWKDTDGDGVREKGDEKLQLKITTTDWPEYIRTAELVADQWKEIGVATEISSFGAGTIQQTVVRPRDYEILLFGEILPAEPDPYPFWHSTQTRSPGLNFALFKDDQVDKLLEEARKTHDPAERRAKYLSFQERISDLKPAIIMYRPYYLFAQRESIQGMNARLVDLPAGRFNDVNKWYMRTKRVWD